jgi:tetratricopeptide (TPR) repeat protein
MQRVILQTAYNQLADAEEYRRAGQFEPALRITSDLVKKFPAYWAALHTHGLVLLEKGECEEALIYLLLADNSHPDQPMTLAALAQAQLSCGHIERALDCTERGLRLEPDNLDLLHARAEIFKATAQYGIAEGLYARVCELSGGQLRAIIGLANCHIELGRMQEGVKLLQSAAWRWSDAFEPIYELSSVPDGFLGGDLVALLDRWRKNHAETVVDPASFGFAKAWALHAAGRFDEAWEQLESANRLVFQTEQANARMDLERKQIELSAVSAAATGIDWCPAPPAPECPSTILILGPSRSGKSTLESLLSTSGLIRGDESNLVATTVRDTLQTFGLVPFTSAQALPKHVRDAFCALYRERVGTLAKDGFGITITNPNLISDIPYLVALVPNLQLIFTDRDTDDLVFSIYQKHYARGNAYSYSLRTARAYVDWYRSMASVLSTRVPQLSLSFSYADLIERPGDVVRSVGKKIGRNIVLSKEYLVQGDGRGCSTPYKDRLVAGMRED